MAESVHNLISNILILFFILIFERCFQGEGPDWQDFLGIICLLVINSTISFIEENNAGTAAAALMARLAPTTKVSFFLRVFRNYILSQLDYGSSLAYTIKLISESNRSGSKRWSVARK